jgi:hypothetical protein
LLKVVYSFIFGFGGGTIYSFDSIFNVESPAGFTQKASKHNNIINIAVKR